MLVWLVVFIKMALLYAKNTKYNYKATENPFQLKIESILDLNSHICAVGHFAR